MKLVGISLMMLVSAPAAAADAAKGKSVYMANCMACHGTAGDGNGPAAMALDPKPRSFAEAAFWVDKTNEQVASIVKSGRPGTAMAPFPQLTEADMADLVAYLRTFEPSKPADK